MYGGTQISLILSGDAQISPRKALTPVIKSATRLTRMSGKYQPTSSPIMEELY